MLDLAARAFLGVQHGASGLQGLAKARFSPVRGPPLIRSSTGTLAPTPVDRYWGRHTVCSRYFSTPSESIDYLEWRFAEYPLFRDFMGLYGVGDDRVVLDYGCGPGSDVLGFALHGRARRVIGMDVSRKALDRARWRCALHGIGAPKVRLVEIRDGDARIPLRDGTVDHVHCGGVLHHTSNPEAILEEFARVLRPGGTARIMVYNRDSVFFHLLVAYEAMIRDARYAELSVEAAFARSTDGGECPLARCYRAPRFLEVCRDSGFSDCAYAGGYPARAELEALWRRRGDALAEPRLGAEHKEFLQALSPDSQGLPLFEGKHAGVGGVYRLRR
ncbi:MAG: class I SAM-dependent methyltransferase [Methanobacteriota archaeon]